MNTLTDYEAYARGLAHGKQVGASIEPFPSDQREQFIRNAWKFCWTRIFSPDHPLARIGYNERINAAFRRGEKDGLGAIFDLKRKF